MKENKVHELFHDPKTIYFFDVDGVLVTLDFGEYNHYLLDDATWSKALLEEDYYAKKEPVKTFQNFLKDKDMSQVYVISKVMNDIEREQKERFVEENYGIYKDHVYVVYKDEEKLEVMKKVKEQYSNVEDKYFVMIDDTVAVLNHIMDHSHFSTVHISSFIR